MELYVQFAGQFGHNSEIIKHFLLHRRRITAPGLSIFMNVS